MPDLKIGKLPLKGNPRIVVPFNDKNSSSTLRKVLNSNLDIIELRIDQYSSFEPQYIFKQIKQFKKFPILATIRSRREGGVSNLSEQQRMDLFEAIIPKVDAVDVELSSKEICSKVVKLAKEHKKRSIVSFHDFHKTPSEKQLAEICKQSRRLGADIVKIATMPSSEKDIGTLAAFTVGNKSYNLVTIAMGGLGMTSRVFFPILGSLMTYAYWDKPTAPGQLSYEKTLGLFKFFYPKSR